MDSNKDEDEKPRYSLIAGGAGFIGSLWLKVL
jgi:hypothetical protein